MDTFIRLLKLAGLVLILPWIFLAAVVVLALLGVIIQKY